MIKIEELSFLPTNPGCYLFKDKSDKVLYVGKAKNLRKRVSSYFQKRELDHKTKALVLNITNIDFIITSTETEAFVLENNLIKKHYPPYNLDLKDSRRYAYILVHNEELPWLEVVRERDAKGEYYGPFVSGAIRKIVLDVLTRNFSIFTRKPSPRLRRATDPESYNIRMQQAKKILKGKVDELINDLENQMKSSSEKTYYEYALTLKNQIEALEYLKEKQLMEMTKTVDAHIINYQIISDQVYLLVFFIRKGVLEEKQSYNFQFYENFFDDFLTQYYDSAPIPQEAIVPQEVDPSIADYLSKKSGRKVSIIIPTKGDKKDLLELVNHNIAATFFTGSERMIALQEIIKLDKMPRHIECFDISHLSGTNTVASMVTFQDGLPDKAHYRKFKVRTETNSDDYLAMREVIMRRYSGMLSKSMKNPDLIVIDGGIGQLGAAMSILKELKLKIPVISLAKRLEEIYIPGKENPLLIDKKNKGLQLLQSIRDEAHRFAITYQRLLRTKSLGDK